MNAVPTSRPPYAKTSTDILCERNALAARVKILDAVLNAIGAEAHHALNHPEISLTTLCRIEALVSQAGGKKAADEEVPSSGFRPLKRAIAGR